MRRRGDGMLQTWLALALFAVALTCTAQSPDPEAVVARLQESLVDLSQAPTEGLAERIALLEPLIESTHDLPYIARFALGRSWDELSPAQQQRYLDTFERLSVASYAVRFQRLDADTFSRSGAEPGSGGRMVVHAAIHPDSGAPIPLDYVLTETESGWRIVNIVANGVSDLALKRAEYRQWLAEGGFAALMAGLEAQLAELEATHAETSG